MQVNSLEYLKRLQNYFKIGIKYYFLVGNVTVKRFPKHTMFYFTDSNRY